MLSVFEPVVIALSSMPLMEGLVILAGIFIAGFIAWQCLKFIAKGLGQLKRIVQDSQKPVPAGAR